MTTSFLASLATGDTPYALAFAGQGSAWHAGLTQALDSPQTGPKLRAIYRDAIQALAPIALDLTIAAPGARDRLDFLVLGGASSGDGVGANADVLDTAAAVSGPAIVLAQLGGLLQLRATALAHPAPARIVGHSQGVIGAAVARAFLAGDDAQVVRLIAFTIALGAAATAATARAGALPLGGATPLLSIRAIGVDSVAEVVREAGLQDAVTEAVLNGPRSVVYAGKPADLERLQGALEGVAQRFNSGLEQRRWGGASLHPVFDFLPVAAPFHSPLLAPAADQMETWLTTLGWDDELLRELSAAVLLDPADWVRTLADLRAAGVKWIIDLGPGNTIAGLSRNLLEGSGTGVVDGGDAQALRRLDTRGYRVSEPASWERFAPRLVRLPDGRKVLDTAFTRLTGRSPFILPGMTPTTVWPEIVAAAANSGNWAEMAGGGQYSTEVFERNNGRLRELLEPGRSAGFNTMFFDRFMWNLQFGPGQMVPKARRSGSPIDAVTIAAGIPELDEAGELIRQLRGDGFTFVCFKPGTIEQIRQVLAIARANSEFGLVIQVEDGHSGGHHSWENLDDLLLATYAQIRDTPNVVLAVGGGIGTPERAAQYLSGQWSLAYGRPAMPVDAVLLGTASMATLEAGTSPQVKQLLLETPGIAPSDPAARAGSGWVARGQTAGGMTSGLSHLDADMHEIANSSAAAARLIHSLGGDLEQITARREELIAALAKTAKPYFGDVAEMTYAEAVERMVELAFPFADWTWQDRVFDLFQRVEARLNPADHGEIESLFGGIDDIADAEAARDRLLDAYPQARTTRVSAADAAWFVNLCRKHHKPLPFVPVLDADLARWWGMDTLWQSHDERFAADAVRVIPGPVSVAGIDRINEPIGQMFARYEDAAVSSLEELGASGATEVFSRFANCASVEEFLRQTPHLEWAGNLVDNPAHLQAEATEVLDTDAGLVIRVNCNTAWDVSHAERADAPHAVRLIDIPVTVGSGCSTGAYPVVDMARLAVSAYDLLAGAAGVGTTTVNGDYIAALPAVERDGTDAPFGVVRDTFTFSDRLGPAHRGVTGGILRAETADFVPDALVGPCWPTIYAALGSATYADLPVIEGLVNAVHLDHTVRLVGATPAAGSRVEVTGRCAELAESSAGRVVRVELELAHAGTTFATLTERFAIRGRATTATPPSPAPAVSASSADTPRSFLRRARVAAPADMTAFANVSGDFNPIHTATAAAGLSGLAAPLVHGMWLSATAQHVIAAAVTGQDPDLGADGTVSALGLIQTAGRTQGMDLQAWSYQMFGMVELADEVEITVERVGRTDRGERLIEATCRVGDQVVSIGRAVVAAPVTAYVYPGQGIQRQGMGLENPSPLQRQIWERADRHTRTALGFSILAIVRDNPTTLRVGGEVLRHPQGVLNLTQFTQVALATVAYAQTKELMDQGVFVPGSYYAGHSLGEYNALAACADIFPLEQVLEIVYQRGSAMHHLVERDAQGHSNYQMGALRPNQFGLDDASVRTYIDDLARTSGEFLQIVNFNLAGSQYAVAGTVAGLAALAEDAAARAAQAGGRNPFMLIPGIDVPFHSRVLRPGVEAFREKLLELLPRQLDVDALVGRYIPNLVARPFELSREFGEAILEVVPATAISQLLADWDTASADRQATARTFLVELLAWQFASPVRWIETQDLLLRPREAGGLGTQCLVEVGLASSPTLAGLAEKTLQLPHLRGLGTQVLNVERDSTEVTLRDSATAPQPLPDTPAPQPAPAAEGAPEPRVSTPAPSPEPAAAPQPVAPPPAAAATGPAVGGDQAPDLRLDAGDAVRILLAFANKLNLDQVDGADTVETLTNGVSSKRNQILMDIAAELGVSNLEGGAEAAVAQLCAKAIEAAPGYQAFGPVLGEAINSALRRLFGGAGVKPEAIGARLSAHWGLPQSWLPFVQAQILLGSRAGDSVRGGSLASLPADITNAAGADQLIDSAVTQVAAAHGVALQPLAAASSGGGTVDSAELDALRAQLLGADGILATQARSLLAALGHTPPPPTAADSSDTIITTLDAELGANWLESVKPAFDPERAVLLDDRWALAREDLARIFAGQLDPQTVALEAFTGGGQGLAELAKFYRRQLSSLTGRERPNRAELADFFGAVAQAALASPTGAFLGQVAVVTGAAPNSIAGAVVARLLAGGATVIATSSRVTQARLAWAKSLYRDNASLPARLWLVPANLAALRDIDALVDWIGSEQVQAVGGATTVVKEALLPDLFFPFAAPPVAGTLGADPHGAMAQERLLVWSVERMMNQLAGLGAATATDHRIHVILPGSPNRGTFGGDGAYGEAKAAFDAIVNKWSAESGWPQRLTLAHPRIGWVGGTSLMGGNDLLIPAAEAAGVHVYDTAEMADKLLELATPQARSEALTAPLEVDLTGGLEDTRLDLPALAAQVRASQQQAPVPASERPLIKALPNISSPRLTGSLPWGRVDAKLADQVVIVGLGEVSAWGSGRTRDQAEYGDDFDLTAAGVLELAWMMGLVVWQDSPAPGWYDQAGQEVAEADIYDRFRDQVIARCGVRRLTDRDAIIAAGSDDVATVYLDTEQTFAADSAADAQAYLDADPARTEIWHDPEAGVWMVRKAAGSPVRVPRRATLSRTVGGQLPTDFDPAKWGIPPAMLEALDPIAVWNLVTAVDAFVSAGFSPAELLQVVHPAEVSSTQGTGIGGMQSLRKVFLDRFLGEDRPQDILQEALPNVVAAHTMQSYIGGYGQMIHPVGACATAAISIEEGVDKIRLGKSAFVVAGGIDTISVESLTGFGDMNATAESAALAGRGIDERFYSRAGDRRRAGFLEAEGGGTVLLTRGDIAADMGLPVYGVVAYAQSFADGAHTSIPAPGMGALGAGRGGADSGLAQGLAALGLTIDDVAVVSKHDTSTNANDPNEAQLHARLGRALGRTPGNPLYVISQKTLTGHAKGGAAVFQVAGLCQVFNRQQIPGNRALDCLDPVMRPHLPLVWLRSPLDTATAPVRAGVLTSLGFGHVAALIVIAHPSAFETALGQERGSQSVAAWRTQAQAGLAAGARDLAAAMCGGKALFQPISGRRLPAESASPAGAEVEARLLLDPHARLGADGRYHA